MNNTDKNLLSIAMFTFKYAEALHLDDKKISSTLGIILRKHEKNIKNLSNQELALLTCYLSDVKEEYYQEYLNLFKCEILDFTIKNASSILEQFQCLEAIEGFYYTFKFDEKGQDLFSLIKSFQISDIVAKML